MNDEHISFISKKIDKSLFSDKEFMMFLVKKRPYILELASKELKNDRDVVKTAIDSHRSGYMYTSKKLQKDTQIIARAIRSGLEPRYLEKFLDPKYILDVVVKNEDIVLALFEIRGFAELQPFFVKYPSDLIRTNRDFILKILKVNADYNLLKYMSSELRNDKEIAYLFIKESGFALEHLSDEIKNNKELVMLAVNNFGSALDYASDNLKKDKEIVLAAVKSWVSSLQYASDELKNDIEIVRTALSIDGEAFIYCGNSVKKDESILELALLNTKIFYGLDEIIESIEGEINEELLVRVALSNPLVFSYVSNINLIKSTLTDHPHLIMFLNDDITMNTRLLDLISDKDALMLLKQEKVIKNESPVQLFKLLYELGIKIKVQETKLKMFNFSFYMKHHMDRLYYILLNCDYNFKQVIKFPTYLKHYVALDDVLMVQTLLRNVKFEYELVLSMVEMAQQNNSYNVIPILLAYTKK